MAENLHPSISSGNGSSKNSIQDIPQARARAAAAANCSDLASDLALNIQALQILDNSDDCIKVLDLEGRILFMNRGGQALLGIQDITPFLNTSWVEFWPEADRQATSEAIARAAAGEVCSLQSYCPTLNGEPRWWDNKISPIRGADGNVERLLCISRDITERRQIEVERKQAEEKLRESEERYRAIVNQAVTGVACTDLHGQLMLVNQKYCDITGYSADELSQRRMQDITHPEDLHRNVELFHRMRTDGAPFEIEKRYIRKDGSIVWVNNSVSVIRDRNGNPQSAVAIVLDITERKQTALNAELLATVTQDLAEATCVEDIIQTVGEQLHQYLQISICAFVEIDESAEVAAIHHSWYQQEVPSLVGVYHLAEFVTDEFFQAAKAGRTIIVRDVTTDPQIADPEQFAALKIGSFINVPLIRENEWKFTLGIYHQTPYDWHSTEIELMRQLANRIWTKLERTRVEIALRQSQGMFSALVADAPFGVYMIDAEFRFRQANQTAVKTFNIQPLVGHDLAEALRIIWHEPFATEAIAHFRHTLATGESYYSPPITETRADIEEIQSYDWQLHRITLLDGSYGVVCYFYDLSEIKRAEEIIRRNGDRDAFLVSLNDALRPLNDPIEIQATAIRVLGEYLGSNRVTYFEIRGTDYVVEQNYVNGAEPLWGSYPVESFGAELLAAYRNGLTATSTDVAIDLNLSAAQRSAYADVQIAAYIGVPLVKQGDFVAGLAVHSSTARNWAPDEIALAEEVAERTWAAVERARAQAALHESEAKYRGLFESLDEGYFLADVIFDENNRPIDIFYLEANPAATRMVGQDFTGRRLREITPNYEAYWYEIFGRVAQTGVGERLEQYTEPDQKWYDFYVFKVGDENSRRVSVVFNDITERKQAEAAIAADLRDTQLLRELSIRLATEESIQALYQEIMAAAIALTQSDAGTVQILDESTQELVLIATQGFEPNVIKHFHRVNASSHTSCGIALRSGVRNFIDFDGLESEDLDGALRIHAEAGYYSAQSTPLISRSGKSIGMVSTHWRTRHRPSDRELRFLDLLARQAADLIEQRLDEAQRKQLLEREQAAREAAEQANRIKDEFLAVLSHELRSPLNPILGWSKLLQSGKLDETKTAQALATIERNAKLQSELIEDLLDVSRILRGKLSLNVASVNLAVIVRGAMETVRLAAEAKSIRIEANLSSDVSLVLGDATRLQQVVWNLLSNAVKFTPEGGQVTIQLECVGSSAHITVSDTGQGIAPDFLPHVFDYFRQADAATTRKFGGLGLGLAIVRHLAELHGGTVRADSLGDGQGATFTIRLPLMPTSSQANQDERSPQPSLDLNGIKILVVDDEPDTRDLVAFVLEQQGAQVITATSAHEVLLVLPQAKPDVLLSDIGMPEMDGYMLIQQVRVLNPDQGGEIPAIALTAYAGDTNQQQVLAAGFQKHISKPIEPGLLVQAIVELLRST